MSARFEPPLQIREEPVRSVDVVKVHFGPWHKPTQASQNKVHASDSLAAHLCAFSVTGLENYLHHIPPVVGYELKTDEE